MSLVSMPPTSGEAAGTLLAARIRRRRISLFLTQEQLASAAGLGRGTVQRLEAGEGRPRMATITALAGALGIAALDLVTDPSRVWGDRR